MRRKKTGIRLYLCAFFLPFLICILICVRNRVYPFGETCILHVDMYHQYAPFFTEFMDKLKHGGSLLYSFRLGIGSDFVSLFAYYLASPFNWLLLLCPSGLVIEFMTLLVLVKTGLCGLFFAVYLRRHFQTDDGSIVLFSSFYALSGYMAAYSWNIMWLDVVALAPLVVLGLFQLVKEKKCGLYCASLAAAILCNYYMAMLLCLFLALLFVIVWIEEKGGFVSRLLCVGRFALYSLLAGGMGAVLLLPEAAILSYSGSSGFSFPQTMEWYFDLTSMLARHCIAVEPYTGRDHFPNLYCGAAVFLFLLLYLFNRSIAWSGKIKRVLLLVLFWLSFSNNFLDFVWHGLHFPDSLPGRQSYLYVFLLLTLGFEAYQNISGNTRIEIASSIVASAACLAVFSYGADDGQVSLGASVLTVCLTVSYGTLLLLKKSGRPAGRLTARYLLCALAVLELFVNFALTGLSVTSRTAYTKHQASIRQLLAKVEEAEEEPFYRVEEMERMTKNDAALYGYRSATTFSSLMNIGVSRFYRKMGMEGGKNFYSYSGATPLSSAMLAVKYVISDSPYEESPLVTLAADDGQTYIYKNHYTLPLGFMADVDLEAKWDLQTGKGRQVANLNRLACALGAKGTLLAPVFGAVEAGRERTTITVEEDGYLYGTYTDTSVTNLTVTNQKRVRKFSKCEHGYLLDFGWCKKGDVLEITNTSDVSHFTVQPYRLDLDVLHQAFQKLCAQPFQTTRFADDCIEGYVDVKEAGNLLLSIPKEEGWRVYVDGKETDCGIFMDSLMKIPLIPGRHNITLRYRTPGLLTGAAISLFCLTLFLCISVGTHRKRRRALCVHAQPD